MAKLGARIAILSLLLCGGARAQCLPGGLAVVVNKSNSLDSLSVAQLRKLIVGDMRAWPDHKQVALIARFPSSKVFQCMLSSIVHLSVGDYQRYVINAEFRGDDPMTMQLADSDATAGKAVSGTAGAFAVVETTSLAAIGGAVKVLRIDGKAPGQPGYPL